jgi:hypothetical protein
MTPGALTTPREGWERSSEGSAFVLSAKRDGHMCVIISHNISTCASATASVHQATLPYELTYKYAQCAPQHLTRLDGNTPLTWLSIWHTVPSF